MIRAGRVQLNGRIARDPETPVQIGKDRIEANRTLVGAARKVYLMMNKPRGAITTASDEKGRETVHVFLPQATPFVGAVGRLDKASEGLLLFTNDSEWAARLTAPETHLDKKYHVQVAGEVKSAALEHMVHGIPSQKGETLRAKSAEILRRGEKNTWLVLVLDEGKNRQIRRMIESLQMEVLRLVRVAIGPQALGELAKGECRSLTRNEKQMLDQAMDDSSQATRS